MRILTAILFLFFGSYISFGQKIYHADREAFKSNNFSYEFFLFNDSTCYIKGHYPENSIYFLYHGTIKKKNDTLYEFKFQPIVEFDCNRRSISGDNVRVNLTPKDTTIHSLTYSFKMINGAEKKLKLKIGWTTVKITDVDKEHFSIDTKFIDPLTKKEIHMFVDPSSEPNLTYYGSKTAYRKIKISIVNDKLTVYPDFKFIHDKDTFTYY